MHDKTFVYWFHRLTLGNLSKAYLVAWMKNTMVFGHYVVKEFLLDCFSKLRISTVEFTQKRKADCIPSG